MLRLDVHEIARRPVELELVWVATEKGVKLAWNVNISVAGTDDWWNVQVDAQSATVLQKDNWTQYELHTDEKPESVHPTTHHSMPVDQNLPPTVSPQFSPPAIASASYRVFAFPLESPVYGTATLVSSPWLKAGAGNAATTNGWHYDGLTNYNITRGNNVWAYLDVDNTNTANETHNWSDTSTTIAPALTFDKASDPMADPSNETGKKQALTNVFYWSNINHDIAYQYGFTEAAGNFQNDNLGRGGNGNDYVKAEAHDMGKTNNAFFTTPPDGTSGRMQLHLFDGKMTLHVASPAAIASTYAMKENAFSAPNKLKDAGPVTAHITYYNDGGSTSHTACVAPSNDLAGKIVLMDQGDNSCAYIDRVARAQSFGAVGVIIISAGTTLQDMYGNNAAITIPAVMVSSTTGAILANQLALGESITATLAWTPRRDPSLDNGIISHEYGHGISTRLTGGPFNSSCLANGEQPGEGWSDYLSLMLTTDWQKANVADGTKARTMGNFAWATGVNGPGLRRCPYSTNMAINPLTYADMPSNTGVHKIGEIWCSALWDMTWNLIQQTGTITPDIYQSNATGGNVIALNLVITGMKLQKCSPGFLDARDAILAADSILYNKAYHCTIWKAFARRGMGVSAVQGSSASASDGVAAFDVANIWLTRGKPVKISGGATQTLTSTVGCNCECGAPAEELSFKDSIPAGFSYVSSNGGVLSGQEVIYPAFKFSSGISTKTFSLTLRAPKGCAVDTVINDNRDGSTVGGFTSNLIEGFYNWTPSFDRVASGLYAWFARNATSTSNFTLTSSPFVPGAYAIFSFHHFFKLESGFDGGVVELSTDGSAWIDAAPYFIENGYTIAMDESSLLHGRKAFTAYSNGFIRSQLDLSSFQGQSLRIRFRMTADNSVQEEGWYIDDIVLANGCGGHLKSSLMKTNGELMDYSILPLFALPGDATLPLTLVSFTATKSNAGVVLHWETANEIDTDRFVIEHTTDSRQWTSLGNVQAKGQGNADYQFSHANPGQGQNAYRLKMVDVDQQFTYSPVRILTFSAVNNLVVYPNPAKERSLLTFQQPVISPRIQVMDMAGRVVEEKLYVGEKRQIELMTQGWPSGTYMILIHTKNENFSARLIITK